MKFVKDIFSDGSGNLSSMRFFSFIALLCAFVVTFLDIFKGVNHFEYVIAFLSGAFGGKAIQRFAEEKKIDVVEKEIK